MQKPRPREALAPHQQRPKRETRASTKGASAPFVVPGTYTAENTAQSAAAGAKTAKPRSIDPALIVFGRSVYGIPQAAWFGQAEAGLAIRAAQLMGLRVLTIEDEAHRLVAAQLRQGQVYASDRTFAPVVGREVFDKLCELAGPVGAASVPDDVSETRVSTTRPVSWEALTPGHVVLATEEPDDGWWEAVVIGAKADKLVLRWRDAAREASFTRAPSELALLPPVAA